MNIPLIFIRLEMIGQQRNERGYYLCSECFHLHLQAKAAVALVPQGASEKEAKEFILTDQTLPHYFCAHHAECWTTFQTDWLGETRTEEIAAPTPS